METPAAPSWLVHHARHDGAMTPVRRPRVARVAGALASATLLGSLVAGCADSEPGSPNPTEASVNPTEDPTQDPTEHPTPTPSGSPSPTPVVAAAVADLAATLGVDEGSVEVVSQEAVTWRDGSLGCARPGMSYTQALVEGSRIVLRADGATYEYHTGGSRAPFHCPKPTE